MKTEKWQFYSDALIYNHLQNILDLCQKNTQISRVTTRFFRSNS